jgi:glycerol-1-phosphate dehydrogenase [NAD(P)+]
MGRETMNQAESPEFQKTALSLADCLKYADETKELVLKKDALTEIPALLSKYFNSGPVCLIADENTFKAAGQNVKGILEEAGVKISGAHIFPGEPRLHADYFHVLSLKKFFSSLPDFPALVPIAVGSGTINDLVKCASAELKIPYLCVPTAASVDGYTPNGAALLMGGFKQTVPCSAPRALAADPELMARAPAWLASSGFGDLASKIISGTDWIIAEKAGALGAPGEPARSPEAWSMVQNGLADGLKRSVNAAKGDREAVKTLFQSLAITGFAMQYMKNSWPVSGSEHLFSHTWEMEDLSVNGVPVTHGHKVAIGTLAATAFTETFFADPKGPPERAKTYRRPGRDERRAEVSAAFRDSQAHDSIVATAMDKFMDEKTVENINRAFRDSWKDIRDSVLGRLMPYGELKALLAGEECPVRPEAIGLSRSEVIATARRAQMIRNKYNILDLSWDMGTFEVVLDTMDKSGFYLY